MARVVFRSRLLRFLFLIYLCCWAFDQAIEMGTDASWFASVGHARVFWHQVEVRALLFWGFALPALALAVVTMRIVAHPGIPHAEPPTLPPALAGWGEWRGRVLELSWLILVVVIWILGRRLAAHWVEALQFWYGGPWDVALWKLRVGFWVFQLPFLKVLLSVYWLYALVLFIIAALGGGVRALPFLATRHMVVPHRWEKLLLTLLAVVLILRAVGYVLDAIQLPTGGFLRLGDLGVGDLLCGVGVGLCIWALLGLRRNVKRSQLGVRVGVALLVPLLLGLVLWPLRSLGNDLQSSTLERAHEDAVRSAWNLEVPAPLAVAGPKTPSFERNWPLWDDQFLLLAARSQIFNEQGQVVDWRHASEREVDGKNVGIVAGVPASLQAWMARQDADAKSANTYLSFDLQAESNGEPVQLRGLASHTATQTLKPNFYGMSGPPLFGGGEQIPRHGVAGLRFESFWVKLAWAWRLRDPMLLFDTVGAHRLLVFRDIREAARKLAPMFAWDAPHPGPNEWTLEAYSVVSDFPGAPAPLSGPLKGWNAGRPTGVLHLDPTTGALVLGATASNPFVATWKRAMPELWTSDASGRAPFFAYEEASALVEAPFITDASKRGLGEAFWSVRDGRAALVRRASVPVEAIEKLKTLDARSHSEWKGVERLENGVPALWPDARAPGGYWVARPYFAVTETTGLGERVALKHILLSALTPSAPIVMGRSAVDALHEFELQLRVEAFAPSTSLPLKSGALPSSVSKLAGNSLEAQLLRVHEEVEKGAAASDWNAFGKALQRERELLQELARRRSGTHNP